ncbi:hypothetical protein PoB_006129300 [Plakobranchus ocellatus]|uniref:Uncharacterized protein n=1 Tax=Plakobranchus ocellatus TaxID=259542 RepID=A0AAV4CSG1_9GAST|nr:hypothetical protein PoB_006129300 [Plakobranchus ocellatus]
MQQIAFEGQRKPASFKKFVQCRFQILTADRREGYNKGTFTKDRSQKIRIGRLETPIGRRGFKGIINQYATVKIDDCLQAEHANQTEEQAESDTVAFSEAAIKWPVVICLLSHSRSCREPCDMCMVPAPDTLVDFIKSCRKVLLYGLVGAIVFT